MSRLKPSWNQGRIRSLDCKHTTLTELWKNYFSTSVSFPHLQDLYFADSGSSTIDFLRQLSHRHPTMRWHIHHCEMDRLPLFQDFTPHVVHLSLTVPSFLSERLREKPSRLPSSLTSLDLFNRSIRRDLPDFFFSSASLSPSSSSLTRVHLTHYRFPMSTFQWLVSHLVHVSLEACSLTTTTTPVTPTGSPLLPIRHNNVRRLHLCYVTFHHFHWLSILKEMTQLEHLEFQGVHNFLDKEWLRSSPSPTRDPFQPVVEALGALTRLETLHFCSSYMRHHYWEYLASRCLRLHHIECLFSSHADWTALSHFPKLSVLHMHLDEDRFPLSDSKTPSIFTPSAHHLPALCSCLSTVEDVTVHYHTSNTELMYEIEIPSFVKRWKVGDPFVSGFEFLALSEPSAAIVIS